MKRFLIYAAVICSTWTISSCGEEDEDTSSLTDEKPAQEEVTESEENMYADKSAVASTSVVYTYDKPGEKKDGGKWVETIPFGASVTLLGDTATYDGRLYVKLKSSAGKEAWAREASLTIDGKVGVATSEIATYSSPDIMSLNKDKKIEFGTIVVVKERPEGEQYDEYYGGSWSDKGYIKKGKGISFNELDLEIAILRNAALAGKDEAEKQAAIQEILDNLDYMTSPLYQDLQSKQETVDEEMIPDEFIESGEDFNDL